ncbi:MAG: MBL fold metallo-hydrolase [Cytophagales bacterium]|nr:MBL fold metallo-hydrolase [Armatimonadota bacterium]
MRLIWYGHAAFLVESEAPAIRVILDPYRAPDVGTYGPLDDWADIVAVSHQNEKYHSHVSGVRGRTSGSSPFLLDGLALLGESQPRIVEGLPFTAVRVFENDAQQEPIAMVGVTVEGIRVLHMGDCGHRLSAKQIEACGPVDVLLALAGGPPTLALPDLVAFVTALCPRVVVPMHFGNEKINLNLRPLPDFLALLPREIPVRSFDSPVVTVSLDSLPAETEVWVLPSAR